MVLRFLSDSREISFRLDDCPPEKVGRYSPSELVISIQQKKVVVDKNPLIHARKSAQEVKTTPLDERMAERIIKYSVMFSAVTMPTN